MQLLVVFLLRLLFSAGLAVVIGRIFFRGTPVFKVALLALTLLALAYLFEYISKRNKPESGS